MRAALSESPTGRSILVMLAVGAPLLVITLLMLVRPALRLSVELPRARLPLETFGTMTAFLTAALAYLRYSTSGRRTSLFLGAAFIVLGTNQLVFGVIVPLEVVGTDVESLFWIAGRLIAGALLVVGVVRGATVGWERPSRRRFLLVSVLSLAALAAVEAILWAFRGSLAPAAADGAVSAAPGSLPSPFEALLGLSGALLYLAVAVGFTVTEGMEDRFSRWLGPALVVAAFSHLLIMLHPTAFTDRVSPGDVLRLAFHLILLLGLVQDARRTYLTERYRARELAAAYDAERGRARQLEELDRARAELFGVLTHELVNPVSILHGFTVTLSKRWPELPDERRLEIIRRMARESTRLRDLTQEAATATLVDTEGFFLAVRAESAAEIAAEAAGLVDGAEERLDLRIVPGAADVVVAVDRARILQVIRNLLSNAVKYSPDGTPIRLNVVEAGKEIVFEVVDRGSGVAEEDVPRLFHRFTRLSAAGSEHVPGSGLGLYISRRIVEAHGGRIWVTSEVGVGSTFAFAVPRFGEEP